MILEESYVNFLIKHDITQNQYLLLHLVYNNRLDLVRAYKEKFPSGDDTMIGEYFVKDLINKGLLAVDDKGVITIGQTFKDSYINKHTASEEVFKIYPTHFMKDGVPFPLSAMDRNIFANLYDTAIMSSIAEHQEVVMDIEYGKEHGLLNIGLDKFVKSKYWLTLRKLRLELDAKTSTKTRLDNEY